MAKNFIAKAIKHPGAEKRAAAKAGDPGTAGKRARLGLMLSRLAKRK